MTSDEIVVLPSGTELSIEAALGDISRAMELLDLAGNCPEASDLEHVAELLELLAD